MIDGDYLDETHRDSVDCLQWLHRLFAIARRRAQQFDVRDLPHKRVNDVQL